MKPYFLPIAFLALALAACQSNPSQPGDALATPAAEPAEPAPPALPSPPSPSPVEKAVLKKAESSLAAGTKAYENGDYKTSQQELKAALSSGSLSRIDQMRANKYLAFIACASNQISLCKAHFLKAFAISQKFSLNKSEASHPIWGPVFQEAKADAAKRK
jgi:hypothetical protein